QQLGNQAGKAPRPGGPPPPRDLLEAESAPAFPEGDLADDYERGEAGRSKAKRAVAQYQEQAAQIVDQSARTRQAAPAAPAAAAPLPRQAPPPVGAAPMPPMPPAAVAAGAPFGQAASQAAPTVSVDEILSSDSFRRAIEREARQARLVRHAVVLGEK